MQGQHWTALRGLLPLYRAVTTVRVADGAATSFWDDSWLGEEPLSELLPALHSHATRPNASVKDALLHGIDTLLQPRRTRAAVEERAKLEQLLTPVRLRHGDDVRVCVFQKTMAAWTPRRCTKHSWLHTHHIPPAPTLSGRIGLPLGSNSLYGYLCSVVSTAAATSSRNPSSPTQRASCVETTPRRWTTSPSHARLLRRYGNTLALPCH